MTTANRPFAPGSAPSALTVLLVVAVTLGGGGISAALGNLAVQIVALGTLAIYGSVSREPGRGAPRSLVALTAATMLVPVLQLVPLPPEVWMALPGRQFVSQSLALTGETGWFPLSLDPARTFVAFLALLPPVAVIVLGLKCDPAGLARVQKVLIATGVAAAAFGTLHLISDDWGDLYAGIRPLPGVLVATFADRNAAALFFVACLLLLVGLPDPARDLPMTILRVAIGGFLAVCVVLTGSRTGMVFLIAPTALLTWRVAASRSGSMSKPRWLLIGSIVLLVAIAAATVASMGRGKASLDRFALAGDGMRAEMREDAVFTARRYWPAGAGTGTFDEVFQVDESLEYVSPRRAGRAHMEYLEVAIESGLAGILVITGWLAWLLAMAWRAVRRASAWSARAAALIGAAIALQSLVLFPLRNEAMLCVAAFAIVLLVRSPVLAIRTPSR